MDKPKTAPVIHERPKMPRATWEALRNHIIKERKRKQEEEEKSEEYERLKKEREHRKKQEATSLEETKEQIADLERKLANLKDEKHQLFLTLKKVLNEDETRRRKETDEMNIMYGAHSNTVLPIAGHVSHSQHMYLKPQARQPSLYMKPHMGGLPPQQPQQVKRQRTPSPPTRVPLSAVSSAYYRPAALPGARLAPTSSIYGHPSASSTGAPIYAMSSSTGGTYSPFLREEDNRQVYLSQAGRFIQPMEASGQKAAYAAQQERERGRIGMGSGQSGHGQPVALTASRPPGSITSGFPLRSSAGYASTVTNPLISTASSLPPRLAYTQAAAAAQLAASQQQNPRYYAGLREV